MWLSAALQTMMQLLLGGMTFSLQRGMQLCGSTCLHRNHMRK